MPNKHDIQKDFYSRMTEFKKKYKDNDLGKTSEKKPLQKMSVIVFYICP